VFDMHGEYAPLGNSEKGGYAKRYRIAGPGETEGGEGAIYLPYWLLSREEMISIIVDRSDQNAPNQASRFTHHVRKLKEECLIANEKTDVLKTFTVDSPIPYSLADLVSRLKIDNTTKGMGARGEVKGEWEDKLTRFISRLETKIEDRRYGFMFQPPKDSENYSWLSKLAEILMGTEDGEGIKVIDFSEVPADVLPVVTGVLARTIYNVQFWMKQEHRTPVCILCDEAHLYLPVRDDADSAQRQALGAFERIAKEGRKYGVSLLVVSQRPSDVSRTILSQCNNFLILRLTNETDQSVVKRLMPDTLAGMVDALPLMDVGESLLIGDAILLPARIKLDKPKIPPNSATRDFWREWSTQAANTKALSDAVECLRKQTR